jgi:ligand-binding SRPBCC domain-containing protein
MKARISKDLGGLLAHLQVQKVVPGSQFQAFEYLTSPAMLGEQLSGSVNVTWQNPGVQLQQGAEFLFLMERFGVEQNVRYTVDKFVLGHSLTYRQVSGLFASWQHTMKFEDHGNGQTLVSDIVEYEMPFGLLGRLADDLYMRREVQKILEHRLQQAYEKLSAMKDMTRDSNLNAEQTSQ